MGLFHVAYNEYVWKALFLYRHPDRSGGIFLAYWYSVLCETAENGETFCERSKKEQSAKKISRYARNDGMVYIALCEIAENGKLSVKGARNDGVQERFLAALEMTVGENGFISRSV